jgi:hypothetical protein
MNGFKYCVTALSSTIKLSVNDRSICMHILFKITPNRTVQKHISFSVVWFQRENIWNGHLLIPSTKQDIGPLKRFWGLDLNPTIILYPCQYSWSILLQTFYLAETYESIQFVIYSQSSCVLLESHNLLFLLLPLVAYGIRKTLRFTSVS